MKNGFWAGAEVALGKKALGFVGGKAAEVAPGIASVGTEILTQAKGLGEIAFGKLIAGFGILSTQPFGAEHLAAKSPSVLQEVIKNAKPTPGKPNQLEAVLDDGSKVIFRRDIGEHAHPIGKDYPDPVDHYNIEIHVANPARPGKFTSQENVHIVVDNKLQPVDIFLKDKTRININSEGNKLDM